MANTIQTHAAPDLVSFGKNEDGDNVVRVAGHAALFGALSDTAISITIADLRAMVKAGYRAGWNGKCIHVEQLDQQRTQRIET